ncbi:temperature-induced lipocalin-1-like [Durio zibethinus]|uniref:Temperature-induced lipocalin-1-like n=1 Tax=Durio zibethinus TaxID=66656 RepID=A0A6P5ZCM3_DURZI|nr:temperature-induced lipocalin-1-like [Durio zibethinus]
MHQIFFPYITLSGINKKKITNYLEPRQKSIFLQAKQEPKTMSKKTIEVVKNLDISRYMGRWYEIASFPSIFQPRNGVNTRATYILNEDGTVHVLNETFTDGKRVSIEGSAYKADPKSDDAKLKVKFYVPPFLPIIPVVGDYWVLYIDDDYQYALIGNPSRKYLWILCRQTQMDDEIYNRLVQKAKDEGYDVSKLHKNPQSDPPPEGEDTPKDTKGIWWIKSIFGR